ncbi:MAG: HAD-IIB family hydrolase [Synechococcaceae cyanobacterium]|nr:HAD-IIB family hydrolase [Synechococcaceae cyanobacterium]
MEKLLVCTDLDRTLLPNGRQEESPEARGRFARLVERPEVTLAYVSGRDQGLVRGAIEHYGIPTPDWVIGDVGTTIYSTGGPAWTPWIRWQEEIAPSWQGRTGEDLRQLFGDLPELTLQEEEKQNRYKLSYYLPLEAEVEALRERMGERLAAEGIAASLITSVDEAAGVGLLDVLPERATKLHAVEFLMQGQGFTGADTVFAGDSGNDLPVIVSPIPSVLVANAHPATIEEARREVRLRGTEQAFYLARGDFLGMNGNYSAGILEGIAHYHPATTEWMNGTGR